MIPASVLFLCIAVALFAYWVGDRHGARRGWELGYDEGWVDRYFDRVKKDRDRRHANGQFKPKNLP